MTSRFTLNVIGTGDNFSLFLQKKFKNVTLRKSFLSSVNLRQDVSIESHWAESLSGVLMGQPDDVTLRDRINFHWRSSLPLSLSLSLSLFSIKPSSTTATTTTNSRKVERLFLKKVYSSHREQQVNSFPGRNVLICSILSTYCKTFESHQPQ